VLQGSLEQSIGINTHLSKLTSWYEYFLSIDCYVQSNSQIQTVSWPTGWSKTIREISCYYLTYSLLPTSQKLTIGPQACP